MGVKYRIKKKEPKKQYSFPKIPWSKGLSISLASLIALGSVGLGIRSCYKNSKPQQEDTSEIVVSSVDSLDIDDNNYNLKVDPNGTSAILDIPEGGKFTPEFSFTDYYDVHTPGNIVVDKDGAKYFEFLSGSEVNAEKYNFQAIGVNVVIDGKIVSKARAQIGNKVYVPITEEISQAIENGKEINFQEMALRQIGDSDNYFIVASYANGIFDVNNETANELNSESTISDTIDSNDNIEDLVQNEEGEFVSISDQSLYHSDLGLRVDEYLRVEEGFNNKLITGILPRKSTMKPLFEKYVSDRNIDNKVIDNGTMTGWANDFDNMNYQAADIYQSAISQGKSHSESLELVVEKADMAAISTKTDAKRALSHAQKNDHNVVVHRWDSSQVDKDEVSAFVGNLYNNKSENGLTNKNIREKVAEEFGHTMSESTMHKYLV